MPRKSSFIPVVLAALVVGVIAQVGNPTGIWESVAWKDPSTGSPRQLAPFPVPPVNPFAIFGSPTGITLSAMLAQEANTTEHGGATEQSQKPFVVPLAEFAYLARKKVELRGHVHLTETGHDEHEHEHEDVALDQAAIAFGRKRVLDEMKLAYMLDPGNPMATRVLAYIAEMTLKGPPVRIEWKGRAVDIPIGMAASMSVMRFSEQYIQDNGLWPERTLARAWMVRNAWLAESRIARIAGEDDIASSPSTLREVRASFARLLEQAIAEWDAATAAGRARSAEATHDFASALEEAVAFVDQIDGRLSAIEADDSKERRN